MAGSRPSSVEAREPLPCLGEGDVSRFLFRSTASNFRNLLRGQPKPTLVLLLYQSDELDHVGLTLRWLAFDNHAPR